MNSKIGYRIVIFAIALIFGIAYSIPSLLNTKSGSKISLGLDLQGGMYMLLGVKTEEAVEAKIKSIAAGISYYCENNDILVENLTFDENHIAFEILDEEEKTKIQAYFEKIQGTVISQNALEYTVTLTPEEIIKIKEFAVLQSVETIRNRLDQFGLAEPNVAKQGEDKILVELPGVKTQEDEQRARKLIGKTARLELTSVDEKNNARANMMDENLARSLGSTIMEDANQKGSLYVLKQIPVIDGSMLTDARVAFDEGNQPVINFTLDSLGAEIFGNFTGKNVGNRLAIVLDGKVYSAPVIRERIGGGSGQISGGFTTQEAHDLAIALRSGALSASVTVLEKRSIGPSLGSDSIKSSAIALVSGFLVVALFMLFFYGMAGLISNVALFANVFIIIAVMSLFGATLTLPGMVGIVLTIGMAVDANVIINERIRELILEGKSIVKAIEGGYKNALSSIIDANITTLVAAIALYAYGTGPIKGFALTLSIGILASMLTAILGTHGMFEYFMPKISASKNTKKWFGIKRS